MDTNEPTATPSTARKRDEFVFDEREQKTVEYTVYGLLSMGDGYVYVVSLVSSDNFVKRNR